MNKKDTYNKTKNKILLASLLKDDSEDKQDKKIEEKKNGTNTN